MGINPRILLYQPDESEGVLDQTFGSHLSQPDKFMGVG
jgi:hypothetical protein